MTSKHTPGPWIAATAFSSVVGLPIVAQSGRSVASVTFFRLGDGFENHDQESHANARLIAMAPRMYEVLWLLKQNAPEEASIQAQTILKELETNQ